MNKMKGRGFAGKWLVFMAMLWAVVALFAAPRKVLALDVSGVKTETVNGQKTTTLTKGMTLSSDASVQGNLIVEGNLKLQGHYLSVTGDVLMKSDIDLEGGKLYVSGSLHQVDPALYVNGGYVQIGGNYSIEGTEK
ncbi:MAG: hypothetical protein IJ073_03440 [Lachnospiraceae bacterium]|nr:hypothetical protein [Lachnospiraceae bacterium]